MRIVKVNLKSADEKNTWVGTLSEEEYLQLINAGWKENNDIETLND